MLCLCYVLLCYAALKLDESYYLMDFSQNLTLSVKYTLPFSVGYTLLRVARLARWVGLAFGYELGAFLGPWTFPCLRLSFPSLKGWVPFRLLFYGYVCSAKLCYGLRVMGYVCGKIYVML
jgi:hypothetical protein